MENENSQELILDHLVRITQDNTGIKQNIAEIAQRLEKVEAAVIRIENGFGA